ncbi:MAG TPA: PEP-CTERM sorting domain-containing protein [Terriglobales bacterium]|jgi:hypothetical protein
MRFTWIALVVLTGSLAAGARPAQATPVLWTIQNAVTPYGGSITGSFTLDADLPLDSNRRLDATSGNILVQGGYDPTIESTGGYVPTIYFADNALGDIAEVSGPTAILIGDGFTPTIPGLALTLAGPLTDSGGVVTFAGEYDTVYSPDNSPPFVWGVDYKFTGELIASSLPTPVPEPLSWLLLVSGLGVLALVKFRARHRFDAL